VDLEIKRIRVSDLVTDRYQRNLNKAHAKEITKRYDARLTGLPIVSYRENQWYVIDGQHRVNAALELGIEEIQCQVLRHLSYREEAELFTKANVQKRGLNGVDRTFAEIESGDEQATSLHNLFKRYGYQFIRSRAARTDGKLGVRPGTQLMATFGWDRQAMEIALDVLTSAYPAVEGLRDAGVARHLCEAQLICGISEAVTAWLHKGIWDGKIRLALVDAISNPKHLPSLTQVAVGTELGQFRLTRRSALATAQFVARLVQKKTGKRDIVLMPEDFKGKGISYATPRYAFLSPLAAAGS
jgi:hypothetical protein